MTPDVNVLVAASRQDHIHHAVARAWFDQAIDAATAGRTLTLMPMVLASFLRLVTHPRIFPAATPIPHATAFLDALLECTGVRVGTSGPEWPRLRQLCVEGNLSGNDLPDAWLAAATLQLGEHLVSFDRAFRRWLPRSQFTLLAPHPSP